MQITRITVSLGRTENLGNYSNIKPDVTLEAVLEPGDSLDEAREALLREARTIVEAEIDNALEMRGIPARYDTTSPRYWLAVSKYAGWYGSRADWQPLPSTVAIVPSTVSEADLGEDWYRGSIGDESPGRPARLHHALAAARRYRPERDYAIIDCSDGNLSRLPRREAAPAEAEAEATPDLPF